KCRSFPSAIFYLFLKSERLLQIWNRALILFIKNKPIGNHEECFGKGILISSRSGQINSLFSSAERFFVSAQSEQWQQPATVQFALPDLVCSSVKAEIQVIEICSELFCSNLNGCFALNNAQSIIAPAHLPDSRDFDLIAAIERKFGNDSSIQPKAAV